jgi:hypothetical protein
MEVEYLVRSSTRPDGPCPPEGDTRTRHSCHRSVDPFFFIPPTFRHSPVFPGAFLRARSGNPKTPSRAAPPPAPAVLFSALLSPATNPANQTTNHSYKSAALSGSGVEPGTRAGGCSSLQRVRRGDGELPGGELRGRQGQELLRGGAPAVAPPLQRRQEPQAPVPLHRQPRKARGGGGHQARQPRPCTRSPPPCSSPPFPPRRPESAAAGSGAARFRPDGCSGQLDLLD